jgi:putative chitinase
MQITPAMLEAVGGHSVPVGRAEALAAAMTKWLPKYGIDTPLRLAHFLAQCAHETGGWRYLRELGGPTYLAKYDGRKDLGNTQPGDGARFRGRGVIQITGRANYTAMGKELGLDLLTHPELAEQADTAVRIACVFWAARKLNALADKDDVLAITKRINGGTNGLADRKAALARAKKLDFGKPRPKPEPVVVTPPEPVKLVDQAPLGLVAKPSTPVLKSKKAWLGGLIALAGMVQEWGGQALNIIAPHADASDVLMRWKGAIAVAIVVAGIAIVALQHMNAKGKA